MSNPISLFKKRVYDILENRHKLAEVSAVGALSRHDSAVLAAISAAAEKFQEDSAMELAEAAFDGIAATMLTIYDHGLPESGQLPNPNMQRVVNIINEAGKREREANKD